MYKNERNGDAAKGETPGSRYIDYRLSREETQKLEKDFRGAAVIRLGTISPEGGCSASIYMNDVGKGISENFEQAATEANIPIENGLPPVGNLLR